MIFLTGDAARDPAALAAAMLNLERGAVLFEPAPDDDDYASDAASLADASAAVVPDNADVAVEAGKRRNCPYVCLRTKTVYYHDGRPALRLVPRRRLAACAVELGNGTEVRFRPRFFHLAFAGAINGELVGIATKLASAADQLSPVALASAASPTGIVWSADQGTFPTLAFAPEEGRLTGKLAAARRLFDAVAAATGADVGRIRLRSNGEYYRAAMFDRGVPRDTRAFPRADRDHFQAGRVIFGDCGISNSARDASPASAMWCVVSAGALTGHWPRAGRPAKCSLDLAAGTVVIQTTPTLVPFDAARLVRRDDVSTRRPPAWARALAIAAACIPRPRDGPVKLEDLPSESGFAPAAAGEPAAAMVESATRYAGRFSVAWFGSASPGASPGASLINRAPWCIRHCSDAVALRAFRRAAPEPLPAACAACGDPLAGLAFEFCARLAPDTADCVRPTPRDAFATFADECAEFYPRVREDASRPALRRIAEGLIDVPDNVDSLNDEGVREIIRHHRRNRHRNDEPLRSWHDGVATACCGCYLKFASFSCRDGYYDYDYDEDDLFDDDDPVVDARKVLKFGGLGVFDYPAAVRAAPRAPAAKGLEAFGAVIARAEPVYAAGGLPQVAGVDDVEPVLVALLVRGVPGGPVALASARLGDCPELECAELAALAASGCAIVPRIDIVDFGDLRPFRELRKLRELRVRGEDRDIPDAANRIASIALGDD